MAKNNHPYYGNYNYYGGHGGYGGYAYDSYYSLVNPKPAKKKKRGFFGFIFNTLLVLLILIALLVTAANIYIRTQCVCAVVDGTSMCNTLQDGDVLFTTEEKAQRGDIVVMDVSSYGEEFSGQYIVKRVIALGGDSLYCKEGKIYIQYKGETEFKPLEEGYVSAKFNTKTTNDFETVTVEEGKAFLMGDNRDNSKDSRLVGAMEVSKISGVVTDWSLRYKDILKRIYGNSLQVETEQKTENNY